MIEVGKKEGIDPRILWAIGYNETKFVPVARSPVGALGMMQFMPGTAARFGLSNPSDPVASVAAAAKYVRYLNGLFPDRPDLILAAYNAGEVAVKAYLEGRTIVLKNGKVINRNAIRTNGVPPYAETQNYVRQGILIMNQLSVPGKVIVKAMETKEVEATAVAPKSVAVRASIYLYGDGEVKPPTKGASIILYP